jgi:hypothetical protein
MTFRGLPVRLDAMPDNRSWVVVQDLVFGPYTVPAGFVTDLASLPAFLRWWTDPWGRHGHAAIVHDLLYWTQKTTRRQADDVFLRGMKALRVRTTQRYALWLGVRLFGWLAWRNNRDARLAGFLKVLHDVDTRAHVERLWAESLEG